MLLLLSGLVYAKTETEKKVLAFYYTWYGTPTVSSRWHHWTEGGHNPDKKDERGLRDIGSTNHPDPDVYDSNDPALIRAQLALCDEIGIDALIATWWHIGDFHDKALVNVLKEAVNFKVKLSVYYETVASPISVESAAKDLIYILKSYGNHPAFLKYLDKPVIFIYGRAINQLSPNDWREVIKRVKSEYDPVLIADTGSKELIGMFDGGHTYNPVGSIVRGADMAQQYADLVQKCRQADKIACATVIPGYDDSHIGRQRAIVAPRKEGKLYEELWQLAIQAKPDWILITSFNEWHEGSEVEPSLEHKGKYANLTREFADKFK